MDQFPNLSAAPIIAVDTETKDPQLKELGPGYPRKDGHVVGISLAVPDGPAFYLPIQHEAGGNLDKKKVIAYVSDQLGTNTPKTGANCLYDMGWLRTLGVPIKGLWADIQGAEALLDENRQRYSLDSLALDYVGEGKDTKNIAELVKKRFGKTKGDPRAHIFKLSGDEVAPYATQDARLPLAIWKKQEPLLKEQDLWSLFELEMGLLHVLLDMRFLGVAIDVNRAEKLLVILKDQESIAQEHLDHEAGFPCRASASKDILRAFKANNLEHTNTEKGNPSFKEELLRGVSHPLPEAILEVRKISVLRNTFVEKSILGHHVDGRIFCSFHPLKSGLGGTVTGRFSSSKPNLQQVPARDEVRAPLIRGLFVPDKGCKWWSLDYSQVEFRLLVHYAALHEYGGALEAAAYYKKDPGTDYHQMVADLAGIDRKAAKNLNFGLAYGMGKAKLARTLNLPEVEARELLATYHRRIPFVRALSNRVQEVASARGFIRTLLNRRQRFPGGKGFHKAMNKLIQGSAADVMKRALLLVYQAGYTPMLTVHDELDFSLPAGPDGVKQAKKIQSIMEEAVSLEVPLLVDVEAGPSWGQVK